MLVNDKAVSWNRNAGYPDDFTGDLLFSTVFHGSDEGGTITKLKHQFENGAFHLIDSITGGRYDDGGTWEWLISKEGKPKLIIFRGNPFLFMKTNFWSCRNTIGNFMLSI